MSFSGLFKGAHGPLLALCALIGVLWAGSFRSIAHVRLPVSPGGTRWEFTSYRGMISVARAENYPTRRRAVFIARPDDPRLAADSDDRYWTAAIAGLGFEDTQIWVTDADGQVVARRWMALSLPYWLLLSLAALAPAHSAYLILRAYRRTTRNQCGECGYELGDGTICQACAARAALIGEPSRVQLVR